MKRKHWPVAQVNAAVAHALDVRGELERILFGWASASTMRDQVPRRFAPLPPPKHMR
ncbi:hypothetical protein WCQ02_18005 [Paraburkholderia tropica]|uniref:hypothetical protein n=1 Tax=Paraburkholderia tropica TaxID=92647 RepID=UPI003017FE6C